MIRELNEKGRSIRYADWLAYSGCSVSSACQIPRRELNSITLGEIADRFPMEGRACARFAAEHLNREDLTKPYFDDRRKAAIRKTQVKIANKLRGNDDI